MRVSKVEREKDFNFPVILENQSKGLLVLATGYHGPNKHTFMGVVIEPGDSDNSLGESNKFWLTEAFSLFKGSITIEQ